MNYSQIVKISLELKELAYIWTGTVFQLALIALIYAFIYLLWKIARSLRFD